MVSRPLSELAERLRKARREGQPWHVIARPLQAHFAGRQPMQERRSVWDAAAAATGLAWVMLRRYVVVIDRIDEIALAAGRPAASLLSGSFSAVELAVRIHARDPAAGLAALEDLAARRATIEDLRTRLGSLPPSTSVSDRQVAMRERGFLIEKCESTLRARASDLFGKDVSVVRRPPIRFCRTVGYDILGSRNRLVAGCDLYVDAASRGRDPLDEFARSVLLSRFYPRFFLVLAPALGDDVRKAADSAIDLFEVRWIGVIALSERGGAEIVRKPRGRPLPDLTGGIEPMRAALAGRARS